MRIDLRADASPSTGAGHVMRVLTAGAALAARGHEVTLHAHLGGVGWLADAARDAGVTVRTATSGTLARAFGAGAGAVVVDSYEIPAAGISRLAERVPVLAIIDGDARGIRATRYLDHNLGSESHGCEPGVAGRLLAGSRYALIRDAVLRARRADPVTVERARPLVAVVPGGTDASSAAAGIVASLTSAAGDLDLRVVATAAAGAAGIAAAGLGPTIDAADGHGSLAGAGDELRRLLEDGDLRRTLSLRMRATVDGHGARRVADAVEAMTG